MKRFRTLDHHQLKAFYFSALALNFTKAASLAGLTQSGISQHIAHLEQELNTVLFERSKRRLYLTESGAVLKEYCGRYIEELEALQSSIQEKEALLEGIVSYAMPASCLKTPHFPILLERRRDFPDIEFDVRIESNNEILEKILNREIDFGFMTKKVLNSSLEFHHFATEEFVLVGDSKIISRLPKGDILKIPFVSYPGLEALIEGWQKTFYPNNRNINIHNINICGMINDLDGAMTMCREGLGVSIFPKHCVSGDLKTKKLKFYKPKKEVQAMGNIYIVHLKKTSLPARVAKVLETFWSMKH